MWFLYLIFSVASAFGLSIALVKKGEDWPVSFYVSKLRKFLGFFHNKLPEMLDCVICTSFWATLLTDLLIFAFTGFFFWPLSGFITLGLSWVIMDALDSFNSIGSKHDEE